jgi:beta-glucosidase
MFKSSDWKKQTKQEFLADQEERKARRVELAKLPADQRRIEARSDREQRKQAKKDRKLAIKSMSKEERKLAKKQDKYYRKLETRTRRYIVNGILLALLAYGVFALAPYKGDIDELMGGINLTTDTPAAKAALEHGEEVAEMISDEGIVLLKNEGDMLPLQDPKLNVFGFNALNFRLGGGGSGGSDQSRSVDFYQGLANAGIQFNPELHDFYVSNVGEDGLMQERSTGVGQVLDMMSGKEFPNEPVIDYLTDNMIQQAKSYSPNALIVLASSSVEASDAALGELKISENERALIEKVAANFDNVVIVINAGNALELGFLDEYPSLKAALWVGTPGSRGANSLGKVLIGEVNPSGRLVDTYAYDAGSNPGSVNFGDYDYTNIKGISFLDYEEGIYIGYRFYETFYKGDEAGYQKAVQFPFGYGLSYTNFDWEVTQHDFNDEAISLDVKVTNTGDIAGKDVVEVYFSAPYYEGGIEKSAIELAGYAKTDLLAPGQSETVTISFPTRDMSSYDMNVEQAYVLDAGEYQIHVSKDVHTPVETFTYQVDNAIVYDTDEATGTEITNQFDYANGDLTYLSRNDWEGTYPSTADMSFEAPQEVVDNFNTKPAKVDGVMPTTGADNGIMLKDLKGLAYDDPKWEVYLDQFTIEEMKMLVTNGAYKTLPVERLGLPATVLLDGPAGINFFFKSNTTASYPTEVVIASTWNDELAYIMGEAVGAEANAYGVQGWYAPGMNVHRTPQGGRNFEFFSEDPLLSGKMSANMVQGAQSKNILVFMKHFILNEQEINARSGIAVWASEQAIREIYLRPFEITTKEGHVTGVMSSFIHVGHKWAGGNPELLNNVLRDEWGFVGVITTDAVLGGWMDLNLAIRNGNDLMLAVLASPQERYFDELYKEDPVGVTMGLRERVHNICYAVLEYTDLVK